MPAQRAGPVPTTWRQRLRVPTPPWCRSWDPPAFGIPTSRPAVRRPMADLSAVADAVLAELVVQRRAADPEHACGLGPIAGGRGERIEQELPLVGVDAIAQSAGF